MRGAVGAGLRLRVFCERACGALRARRRVGGPLLEGEAGEDRASAWVTTAASRMRSGRRRALHARCSEKGSQDRGNSVARLLPALTRILEVRGRPDGRSRILRGVGGLVEEHEPGFGLAGGIERYGKPSLGVDRFRCPDEV